MAAPPRPAIPRLLAATGPLFMTPLDRVMDAIAEAGFDAAEVMIGQSEETQDPARILAAADRSGLEVLAIHGPFLLLLRNVLGTRYSGKATAAMEIAGAVGAGIMVAHAPFRWERRSRRFIEEEVAAVEEATGVRFGMENLFPVGGRAYSSVISIEDMAAFDNLVMDTSHCAVAGIDIFEMWEALRDRIVHLHIADNFGNGKDSHAPIGAGILDLEGFLGHVGASGWDGTVTLELDCRPYLDSHDSLVSFLGRERQKALAALSGRATRPVAPAGT